VALQMGHVGGRTVGVAVDCGSFRPVMATPTASFRSEAASASFRSEVASVSFRSEPASVSLRSETACHAGHRETPPTVAGARIAPVLPTSVPDRPVGGQPPSWQPSPAYSTGAATTQWSAISSPTSQLAWRTVPGSGASAVGARRSSSVVVPVDVETVDRRCAMPAADTCSLSRAPSDASLRHMLAAPPWTGQVQVQAMRELELVEHALHEERRRNMELQESFNARFAAQQEAHERDVHLLEQMVRTARFMTEPVLAKDAGAAIPGNGDLAIATAPIVEAKAGTPSSGDSSDLARQLVACQSSRVVPEIADAVEATAATVAFAMRKGPSTAVAGGVDRLLSVPRLDAGSSAGSPTAASRNFDGSPVVNTRLIFDAEPGYSPGISARLPRGISNGSDGSPITASDATVSPSHIPAVRLGLSQDAAACAQAG